MIYAIQKFFGELGEAACYFICLALTSNRMLRFKGQTLQSEDDCLLSVPKLFLSCAQLKLVHYNDQNFDDPKNCEVQDTPGLLKFLLDGGVIFRYSTQLPTYEPKANEFVIEKWARYTKGNRFVHFVLPDYDPLGDSNTKKFGSCIEKRVFTVV